MKHRVLIAGIAGYRRRLRLC